VSELRVVAEQAIGAPATHVYRLIADFDRHHPRFLPPAFSQFRVEQGGVGAGTVHSFRMTAGGRARNFRMRVEEPDPGRVLTESDDRSSMATTWVVTPEGPGCRVRLETRWQGAGGVGGLFERLFAPRVLRRLYAEELERLDRYARTASPG
jgi:ribosome-associated toxin RatA of RatAB toxin-antitoxin module